MIITIDGPAASGKSTTARLIADTLGYYYLNSGFLYRALGYLLLAHKKYDEQLLQYPRNEDIEEYLNPNRLHYYYDSARGARIFFDDQELTSALKSSAVDRAASIISSNPEVRDRLLAMQRNLAEHHDIVAEGRDMGTIVFPDANFKFFLTASLMVRAQRWQHDQKKRGKNISIHDAMQELRERDDRDTQRTIAPLQPSPQAVEINTSALDIDATVQKIVDVIEKRQGA
jgi:cytidylate kinase